MDSINETGSFEQIYDALSEISELQQMPLSDVNSLCYLTQDLIDHSIRKQLTGIKTLASLVQNYQKCAQNAALSILENEKSKLQGNELALRGSSLMKEVSRREVSRRVVRQWQSGNTIYTEIEITYEVKYQTDKGQIITRMQNDMQNIQQAALEQTKSDMQADLQNLENVEKGLWGQIKEFGEKYKEGIIEFVIIVLMSLFRIKKLRLPKRTQMSSRQSNTTLAQYKQSQRPPTAPQHYQQRQLPAPSNSQQLLLPRPQTQLGDRNQVVPSRLLKPSDRTTPQNLQEQILQNNLSKIDMRDARKIAEGDNIRISNQLMDKYGGKVQDWQKIGVTTKSSDGKCVAEMHAHYNPKLNVVADAKFKQEFKQPTPPINYHGTKGNIFEFKRQENMALQNKPLQKPPSAYNPKK